MVFWGAFFNEAGNGFIVFSTHFYPFPSIIFPFALFAQFKGIFNSPKHYLHQPTIRHLFNVPFHSYPFRGAITDPPLGFYSDFRIYDKF